MTRSSLQGVSSGAWTRVCGEVVLEYFYFPVTFRPLDGAFTAKHDCSWSSLCTYLCPYFIRTGLPWEKRRLLALALAGSASGYTWGSLDTQPSLGAPRWPRGPGLQAC